MNFPLPNNWTTGASFTAAAENQVEAAVNQIGEGAFITSAAGTTTLVATSNQLQTVTGSTIQTIQLPTTSVVAGEFWEVVNASTGAGVAGQVTVQSSGGNTILVLEPGTRAIFIANVATPTTAANWTSRYIGSVIASGKLFTINNTLTLAGTDGTTMTFPGASDTVVGLAATQTLTNKTLTSPTLTGPTISGYTETTVALGVLTTSATLSIVSGTVITATLTASTACTFSMPTATAGKAFSLYLKQPASTGNGTATFTGVKWPGGVAPTITAAAGQMDILNFSSDGTDWFGTYVQGFVY